MIDAQIVDQPLSRTFQWHEVWRMVFFHPSEFTFDQVLADPKMSPDRPFLWIAIVYMIPCLVGVISGITQVQRYQFSDWGISFLFIVMVPIFAVVSLAIRGGIFHLVAGWLGGSGTYNRILYVIGAVLAPSALVSTVLVIIQKLPAMFGAQSEGIGLINFCLLPFILGLALYTFYLEVLGIMAAEKLSGWRSFLTLVLPNTVILASLICFGFFLIIAINWNPG